VIDASACPSHFAITASGTPRRCNAVPQECRASCNRIGRTLLHTRRSCADDRLCQGWRNHHAVTSKRP
jgi:hypothetical protein